MFQGANLTLISDVDQDKILMLPSAENCREFNRCSHGWSSENSDDSF